MRRQVFLYVFEFSEQRRNGYPGYQRFFLACVGEVRFVGRRPTRVRPKAEDMSCEAARKPETAHEKPLAPRVRNSQLWDYDWKRGSCLLILVFKQLLFSLVLFACSWPLATPPPTPFPPRYALKQKPAENEPRLCCETPEMGNYIRHQTSSLRSKRLLWVSEQTKTRERDFRFWPREKWNDSHFSRSLWLSFLVLCSQTARKRLLRRLRLLQMESFLVCYQTSQFCLFVVLFAREGNAQSRNESRLC